MISIRNGILAGAASLLLAGSVAFAQTDAMGAKASANASVTSADRTFMTKAAQGGMAEVELGQLAEQNAQSQDVKNFGKRMVEDHSKAGDQLKQVASQSGVTLPDEPNAKDKATKARLSQMHGEAFDKAYMKDMVADHKEDVAEFKKESSAASNPEVKQWASDTLPTLEEHLKMAEQVASKVGAESATPK
jgi:putative membrane protein